MCSGHDGLVSVPKLMCDVNMMFFCLIRKSMCVVPMAAPVAVIVIVIVTAMQY